MGPSSFLPGQGRPLRGGHGTEVAEGRWQTQFPESPVLFLVESSPRWVFYSAFIEAEAEAASRIFSSHIKLLEGPELQRWKVMEKSRLPG